MFARQGLAETYDRDGYAVAAGTLKPADLAAFQEVISRGVDQFARRLKSEGKIGSLYDSEPFDRRLAAIAEGHDLGMRSWDEVAASPELFDLIRHPAILDAVESILGPEIFFNGDFHLRPKLPGSTLTAFPWHQDSQYYGEPTKHMHIVTITIPLVDLTLENGCLWMIPASQKWGFLAGARGADMNIRTFGDVESRGNPVPVPMKLGDIMLFHNLTVHASKLNTTNQVRWTLDLRYSPTRESRQQAGASPEELNSYEIFFNRLRTSGFHPATVRSQHGPTVDHYAQWVGA